MPFPIAEVELQKTEKKLGLTFPASFRNAMVISNGGEVQTDDGEYWYLYPFFDTFDRKCISRTCNDIIKETEAAKEWDGFPKNAVAIATNGGGDYLFLLPSENDPTTLGEKIFAFWHEESCEFVAESFEKLSNITKSYRGKT